MYLIVSFFLVLRIACCSVALCCCNKTHLCLFAFGCTFFVKQTRWTKWWHRSIRHMHCIVDGVNFFRGWLSFFDKLFAFFDFDTSTCRYLCLQRSPISHLLTSYIWILYRKYIDYIELNFNFVCKCQMKIIQQNFVGTKPFNKANKAIEKKESMMIALYSLPSSLWTFGWS